ncbi:aminoglycoside phosphotransferase family protein [Pseudorhodoferax sp.]|uniref:aminoglycoside phosphotransferase family protein n=1 Tax=Pseudorhodoferax sp. TaxID=1993553 RepID=UPI0039E630AE
MSPHPAPATRPARPVAWADPEREAAFGRWLAAVAPRHGLQPDSLRLASADASFRRYLRIATAGGGTRIVMDAPPDKENSEPFVRIAALMRTAGLVVPEVLEWQREDGFLLLTDLGTQTMMQGMDPTRPEPNAARYGQAIDALVAWQLASRPGVLPPYDRAVLERELALFPDWYLARHRGVRLTDAQRATLDQAFAAIVAENLAAPAVYVHRDFMPRNLMLLPDDATRLGVLDFQDALYGPVTYDIASLMRDAFLSWDEDFVLDVTVRYWQQARKAGLLGAASAHGWGEDFGDFYRAVEWMGLQRHLKVAGIFARLTLRDGKPRYLEDTPRFIAYIRSTAGRYCELAPLLRLVDQIEGTQPVTGYAYGRM